MVLLGRLLGGLFRLLGLTLLALQERLEAVLSLLFLVSAPRLRGRSASRSRGDYPTTSPKRGGGGGGGGSAGQAVPRPTIGDYG